MKHHSVRLKYNVCKEMNEEMVALDAGGLGRVLLPKVWGGRMHNNTSIYITE